MAWFNNNDNIELLFSLIIPHKWLYILIFLLHTCGLSLAMCFHFVQCFLSEFLAVSWLLYGSKNLSVLFTLTFESLRNEAERVEEILKLLEIKNTSVSSCKSCSHSDVHVC